MKYDVIVVGAGSAGQFWIRKIPDGLACPGPDYPDFEHLPDEVKFGFDTGTGVPSMRTPSSQPVALVSSIHNWRLMGRAIDLSPDMAVPWDKVTGGSSAINSSSLYRGIAEDFEAWAAAGNDQRRFETALPKFSQLETDVDRHDEQHGSDGPIFVYHSERERRHATNWLGGTKANVH